MVIVKDKNNNSIEERGVLKCKKFLLQSSIQYIKLWQLVFDKQAAKKKIWEKM